jgi:ABC-2 type transport system permease protein
MSTSLVSLSISTGFDRYYGVLRRLHTTPLTARDLITAKVLSILVTEIIQIVVLGGVAVALGWRPVGGLASFALALVALLLASASFAGIGLVLAGRLRAEINLAASNGLYLVLLLASGFVVPLDSFPSWIASTVELLPSGAVTNVLHSVTSNGELRVGSLLTLLGWAIAAPLVASKTFRFD